MRFVFSNTNSSSANIILKLISNEHHVAVAVSEESVKFQIQILYV